VVLRDAVGEGAVCCGCQINFPSRGVLVEEKFEEREVVRQGSDVQRDGVGDVLLEGGFTLGEPAGDFEDGAGVLAGEGEYGFDEGVGFDEGSVQIDTEGGRRVRFFMMEVGLSAFDGDLLR